MLRLNFGEKIAVTAAGLAAAVSAFIDMLHPLESRAQSKPEALTFDVASVKPASPDARGIIMQFTPGGSVRVVNGSLKEIILLEYHIEKFQISGGAGWLDAEKFDIIAKAPAE